VPLESFGGRRARVGVEQPSARDRQLMGGGVVEGEGEGRGERDGVGL
jgi:hypothetical protein